MNGLKFIRTRCNYSQAALAEMLNVSRQAINMWESSKKAIPEPRRAEICEIFGIENPTWLDEIDEEIEKEISKMDMYKIVDKNNDSIDTVSEHFVFKPVSRLKAPKNVSGELSLDEVCALKRIEMKNLMNDIQDFSEGIGIKNSFTRIYRINTTLRVFHGLLDAMKVCYKQPIEEKMPFVYIVFAVIDALNIAFGNISEEDVINANPPKAKYYYTPPVSIEVAKLIKKNLDDNLAELREVSRKEKKETKENKADSTTVTNP